MDPITRAIASAAAGAAGGDKTYVDDVFSTFLYEGDGSTSRTITNDIDLSGEGGLVWTKARTQSASHIMGSPSLGVHKFLSSNTNLDAQTTTLSYKSFNSNGYTIGNYNPLNQSSHDFVSWTFRKAPGFMDIVTYTGNNTDGRTVAHNLGSTPGMILVKCTSHGSINWTVFHRKNGHPAFSQGGSAYATFLNTDAASDPSAAYWNNTVPTSTVFTVGSGDPTNGSGKTYVAYLFAHDDARFGTNEDESIVKCDSYTGTGGYQVIDIGFEVQWIMIKCDSRSGDNWGIYDVMRGAPGGDATTIGSGSKRLRPDENFTEDFSSVGVDSDGFILGAGANEVNRSGERYTYMAIRRPHKPPTAGTEVFAIDTSDATSPSPPQFTSGFVTDFIIRKTMNGGNNQIGSRLQGTNYMSTYSSTNEGAASVLTWDFMDGWSNSSGVDSNLFCYMFKRAPGFFDVVTYTGTGSNRTIAHNLSSVPEMMIFKARSDTIIWVVYHKSTGATNYLVLNGTGDATDDSSPFNDTEPTASVFTLGNGPAVNGSTQSFVAYLFASLDGISKVGSYSGTGSNIDVDCGFTTGARFVMIKRTDTEITGATGTNWYVWDTTNGIVSGNDPYWIANDAVAAVTNTDYIDPLNAGFTVTSSAPAALNTSGGTYLFLAIA